LSSVLIILEATYWLTLACYGDTRTNEMQWNVMPCSLVDRYQCF